MTHEIDPIIELTNALDFFDGNQSKLAKSLKLSRSVVNEWISGGRELVPPLHAHRLVALHPEIPHKLPAEQSQASERDA